MIFNFLGLGEQGRSPLEGLLSRDERGEAAHFFDPVDHCLLDFTPG